MNHQRHKQPIARMLLWIRGPRGKKKAPAAFQPPARSAIWNLSLHLPFWGMAIRTIQHTLTALGTAGSRPWAFLTVLLYAAAWLVLQPDSLDMHGVATLMVWMMTLFIQRAEYRDALATQAKLDELLAGISTARNDLTQIDQKEPEDIERHREAARNEKN